MLLAVLGLAANLTTAFLFAAPSKTHWSFRAALAHELSDGALTVFGFVGALVIHLFGWRWVDPILSLLIGLWLWFWAGRLLAR
ncbi:MAG TPA: cation transporter [Myxococcota bacterium]|nr:cation transporter [Myxococcota bacterium]